MEKYLTYLLSFISVTAGQLFSLQAWSETDNANETTIVVMETRLGAVEIELYTSKAPITVENFLALVDGGHYDGGSFYRTVTLVNDKGSPKIEVIQGGRGRQPSPFPPITHETTEQTGILHIDGTISMARGKVGTASSEFFICIGDQPGLDFGNQRNSDLQGFAAFGKVIKGMDIVKAINQVETKDESESAYTRGQVIKEPVTIISIKRQSPK